jgi:Fe2+ transport system protein B
MENTVTISVAEYDELRKIKDNQDKIIFYSKDNRFTTVAILSKDEVINKLTEIFELEKNDRAIEAIKRNEVDNNFLKNLHSSEVERMQQKINEKIKIIESKNDKISTLVNTIKTLKTLSFIGLLKFRRNLKIDTYIN